MADYDRYDTEGSGAGFMMGLIAGTVLGAGLGMLLAPKAGAGRSASRRATSAIARPKGIGVRRRPRAIGPNAGAR
jgi:hypothetical protein